MLDHWTILSLVSIHFKRFAHYFFFAVSSVRVCPTSQHVPLTSLPHSTSNIDCLVVSDASGGDRFFLSDAVELRPDGVKETIQLRGPGEILVLSSNATFLRDSQV